MLVLKEIYEPKATHLKKPEKLTSRRDLWTIHLCRDAAASGWVSLFIYFMAKVIWKCCRIGWVLLKVSADVRKCQAKWQGKVHPLFISCNDGCFVWNHWNDANRAIFFNVSQQSLPTLWCSKGHPTDKIWFMLFLIYICVFVYLAYEAFFISLLFPYSCGTFVLLVRIADKYLSTT